MEKVTYSLYERRKITITTGRAPIKCQTKWMFRCRGMKKSMIEEIRRLRKARHLRWEYKIVRDG